jgi:hypothetical protein
MHFSLHLGLIIRHVLPVDDETVFQGKVWYKPSVTAAASRGTIHYQPDTWLQHHPDEIPAAATAENRSPVTTCISVCISSN